MPKKKGLRKNVNHSDFTLNDCANAPKAVTRVKKTPPAETELTPELSWDEINEDDFDIIEEINSEGIKSFVYKKKWNTSKTKDRVENDTGNVYPEIVWYLISYYIKPEDIGRFSGINRATHAITKKESFWRRVYNRYCKNNQKLPEKLRIENSYKSYGLRPRVIRALYHTYDVLIKKVAQEAVHDSKPHQLVKRLCVNVWYCKGPTYWSIFFKLKKSKPLQRIAVDTGINFIEELGKIDANTDVDTQVLQVTCQHFYEVPPLMGMTLSSVSVVLSQGFRHHRLHLGFNSGCHNVSRNILPEYSVVLDTVVNMFVFDWWHPKYPHFDNKLPNHMNDEESVPMLKKDFFS